MRASFVLFAAVMDGTEPSWMVLLILAAVVAGIAFTVTLVLTRGRNRIRDASSSPETSGNKSQGGAAPAGWRDKYLVPIIVSVVSGLITAGITALLGGRSAP